MLEQLHLIRPLWLLALIPLGGLAWQVARPRDGDNPWQRIVDTRLLPLLMIGPTQTARRGMLGLVALGWLVATLALADPTWERKPQPLFQTGAARVVVLDLSSSMNATDLKPTRLARARYKVEDVLALGAEGQTGLVVYAGDAYTVTPLTRDVNTIRSQLNALAPDLMPSDGSRADLGLLKAEELLRQAGVSTGQVLLIADGITPDALAATQQAAAVLKRDGYRVSVLGIRGVEAATNATALRSVAQAGGGLDLSPDAGIDNLHAWVDAQGPSAAAGARASNSTAQAWAENGPFIVLLLLPIAALAFRRNWLLSLLLLPLLTMQPHDAMAATWDDLWQRPEQQAARSLNEGDYAKAARLANDAERRGSAEYKRGNYALAFDDFSRASGPQADYNRGNALAKLGRYPDAISAYDLALKLNPNDADARANKAAVEALLKQKEEQKQSSPQQKPTQGSGTKQDGKPDAKQDASGKGKGKGKGQGNGEGSPADKPQDGQPGSGKGTRDTQGAQAKPADGGKAASSAESKAADGSERQGNEGASKPAPAASDHEFADAARQLAEPGGAASAPQGHAEAGMHPGATATSAQSGAKEKPGAAGASASAQPLPTEEQLAAEQWLRRIPDDPGGLLRRKFLYQYRQRAQQAPDDAPSPN